MAEGHNQWHSVVASITLRHSYLRKLVFPKAVMQTRLHLLPATLQGQSRRADAILKSGNREFSVTFSLGRNHDRLVLLETGWKYVVDQLGLEEGDEVAISLDDRATSTYSIELIEPVLAPVEGPQAEEADIYQGGDEDHINLDQGGATHATAAASSSAPFSSSLQSGHKPVIMEFDLNETPAEADEEEIN